VECLAAQNFLSTASRHDRCHLHSLTTALTCDVDQILSSSGVAALSLPNSNATLWGRCNPCKLLRRWRKCLPSVHYGVLQRQKQTHWSRTSLCLCLLSTMWFKAILWRLLFMVLLPALVCLATPAISGWPESLYDEDVNTPALDWWKVLESAAVICKHPSACSCVRFCQ